MKCWGFSMALGLGLSAAQWIPFLELLANSSRSLRMAAEAATQYSVSLPALLKMVLLPQWYALSPGMDGDPAILCFYVGIPALCLAVLGATRGRGPRGRSREAALACLCILGFLLSLGKFLPGYGIVPLFRVFRYPANWLLIPAMGLGLLTASGLMSLDRRWRWPAAAVIIVDLVVFAQFPRAAWARHLFFAEAPAWAEALHAQGGSAPARIYHHESLWRAWQKGSLSRADDYLLMRDFLAPSFGTAFGIHEARSYQVLRPTLAESYLERLGRNEPRLLDWAGVSAVARLRDPELGVRRGNIVVERAADPSRRIFLVQGSAAGVVEFLEYMPGRARVRARLEEPATVVFSELDYPGWRVSVNGKRVPHERFAGAFVALSLAPGEYDVLFLFGARSFWLGMGISVLAILAGALLMIKKHHRRI